jgi:hypothetical protein
VGEVVIIEPKLEVVGVESLAWFTRPVEVRVLRVERGRVRIGVDAVEGLFIGRGEWSGGGA